MGAVTASKYITTATWDDAPHLDEKTKDELLSSYPPHERDARSKGIPSLGVGAVYPVPVSEIVCDPFQIPDWWPRAYGLDVGWNCTAAVWLAKDPVTTTLHAFTEYRRGQAEPSIHAAAVKARGEWMRGAIDPAARGRGQRDGEQLMSDYLNLGLRVTPAVNAVEAGVYRIHELISTGRLKVFTTCRQLLREYALYHRDEKGRIVKDEDHCLDAWRYAVMTFDSIAGVKPVERGQTTAYRAADPRGGY